MYRQVRLILAVEYGQLFSNEAAGEDAGMDAAPLAIWWE